MCSFGTLFFGARRPCIDPGPHRLPENKNLETWHISSLFDQCHCVRLRSISQRAPDHGRSLQSARTCLFRLVNTATCLLCGRDAQVSHFQGSHQYRNAVNLLSECHAISQMGRLGKVPTILPSCSMPSCRRRSDQCSLGSNGVGLYKSCWLHPLSYFLRGVAGYIGIVPPQIIKEMKLFSQNSNRPLG
ncbi:hypothetical protein F5141DRAFT_187544 [Pisolithus sp. B1]|nr:hypothetical protein F5141DRAFT_187544 [Pisolithus sp. B1]